MAPARMALVSHVPKSCRHDCVLRRLLKIGADDVDELVGAFALTSGWFGRENVVANMAFDDLVHETVHCAAGGGDELKNVGTILLRREGFLNRLDLSLDPADPGQKF